QPSASSDSTVRSRALRPVLSPPDDRSRADEVGSVWWTAVPAGRAGCSPRGQNEPFTADRRRTPVAAVTRCAITAGSLTVCLPPDQRNPDHLERRAAVLIHRDSAA